MLLVGECEVLRHSTFIMLPSILPRLFRTFKTSSTRCKTSVAVPCTVGCCLLLIVLLSLSCGRREARPEPSDPLLDESVPITEVPDAPREQVEALTDTVRLDSTDLSRDYRFTDTYIYISKPRMRLYVLTPDDSVLFSCGIACGIRRGDKQEEGDYRTPEGRFRISGMFESTDWIHRTRDGREVKGCYGPYFLRIATGRFAGIGIHGTNAPRSIGRRASEGCIRVNSDNIILLREQYAYNGMPVIVSGERERLPDFKGLGSNQLDASKADGADKVQGDSLHHLPGDTTQTTSPVLPTDTLPASDHLHPADTVSPTL